MSGTAYLYRANLGIGVVNTANPNLDGSGAIELVYTAGLPNTISVGGSNVKSIRVKGATASLNQGMVRIFIKKADEFFLYKEIQISPKNQDGVLPTFMKNIPVSLNLNSGDEIYASTEYSEEFNVFIEGVDYGATDFPGTPDSVNIFPAVQKQSNFGVVSISTANSNIDGSGTIAELLSAVSASVGDNVGTTVNSITIKAIESTVQGMVRIFIFREDRRYLWGECCIPAVTQNAAIRTYATTFRPTSLVIMPGDRIYVSTERAETFTVAANSTDFICNPL